MRITSLMLVQDSRMRDGLIDVRGGGVGWIGIDRLGQTRVVRGVFVVECDSHMPQLTELRATLSNGESATAKFGVRLVTDT